MPICAREAMGAAIGWYHVLISRTGEVNIPVCPSSACPSSARPTDSAGNVGDYLATPNGGQRWHGNEQSWQYRTIMEWIRGGRLEKAAVGK